MKTYKDDLFHYRSLLLVTSLQKRQDLAAAKAIEDLDADLKWDLEHLLIDPEAFEYITGDLQCLPQLVFCHPDVLRRVPVSSLYYRGLCGLSLKTAMSYFGSVASLEAENPKARLSGEKALKMARTYNAFLCSIVRGSTGWTLENGRRTLIATMGITIDGVMRNKVGQMAEELVRGLLVDWLLDKSLIVEPKLTREQISSDMPTSFTLSKGIVMQFGSEPDVAFMRGDKLLAVIEVKGGTDPAGALERYGASKKSFDHARAENAKCRNFYLTAVQTPEADRRIKEDSVVECTFNIIDIVKDEKTKGEFFDEVFNHALRMT